MKTLGATRAHHGLINKATIMITSQHNPTNNQPNLCAMDYKGVGLPILYKSVYCRANCIQSLLGIRTVPACSLGPRDMCNLTQAACAIPAEGQRGINTRCGTVGNGPNDQFHMLRACASQHAQISPHCLVADIMRTICGNSWNHAAKPPSSALAPTTSEPIKMA